MRDGRTRASAPSLNKRHALYCAFLVGLCAICFGYRVGEPTLWRSQEDRVAWIVRTMIRSGDIVVPRGPQGVIFDDKPPLYHWCAVLASARDRGRSAPSRFALRLPSVIFGTVLVLFVYAWGARCWGPNAGLAAGAVLATTVKFLGPARAARVDVLLSLLLTIMLATAWAAYAGRGRGRSFALFAFYAAAAAATLTKGPVLALLPAMVLALFLATQRDLGRIRLFRPLAGMGLVLLLCGWWFVAVHFASDGGFTYGFFVKHHWLRYFGGEGPRAGTGTFHTYLPLLLGGALPWPILFAFAVLVAVRDWRRGRVADDDPSRLLVLWIVVLVVIFSIGRVKRADYILPAYPVFALLVGRMAFGPTAAGHRKWLVRVLLINVAGAMALCVVLWGASLTPIGPMVLRWMSARGSPTDRAVVERYLTLLAGSRWVLFGFGMVLMGGAVGSWVLARAGRLRGAFVVSSAGAAILVMIYASHVLPESEPLRSRGGLARIIRREVAAGDRLIYVDDGALELSYYVDRPAQWVRRPNGITKADISRWTDRGRSRCFLVMRRERYNVLVAPHERALGLRVVAASIPSHVRPLVVVSSAPRLRSRESLDR